MPSPSEKILMIEKIKGEQIPALYHFTDINNLPLIAELNGLKSKEFLEKNEYLKNIRTGGNEISIGLDASRGNWDKVSLSWCAKHPMAYWREMEQHLCYIIVDKKVAVQENVLFTDRNATDSLHTRNKGILGLNNVNFDAVRSTYPYPTIEIKKQKQAEILVPDQIEIESINYVAFRSQSSLDEAKRLCNNYPEFVKKFTVAERVFYLQTSYVQTHSLTSKSVDENKVLTHTYSNETVFYDTENGKITLLIGQKLIYGTEEIVKILDSSGKEVFSKTETASFGGEFWSWYEIDFELFSEGNYTADFYLTGTKEKIKQFSIPFSII